MSSSIFVFDTNIISIYMRATDNTLSNHIRQHQKQNLILPECVIYEIERGLHYRDSKRQLTTFYQNIIPLFEIVPIVLQDWQSASKLWVFARSNGKQLSDIDFLIAGLTIRLNGILVTDDADFNVLPVQVANWLNH